MKSIILGAGQVGKSLYNVLKETYKDTLIQDKEIEHFGEFDIIHICFPYSKTFIDDVKDYQTIYRPKYTVIHSTVPVGTTRQLQAFHSPVRGIHPHLEKSLKVFVKYLAPKDKELKKYFEKAGIKIKLIEKPEDTEALKIWSTTLYGWNIVFEKEVYKWCKENGCDFNIVYRDANKTYNEGYEKLGYPQYKKYILKETPGSIGGSCVIPNCRLLKHPITRLILKFNKKYGILKHFTT